MLVSALDITRTAVFSASGRAEIVLSPERARQQWKVRRYQCHTNSATATKLTVYLGSEFTGSRKDFTNKGNDDVSEQVEPLVIPTHGLPLRFIWTGGTPGATAEIAITGEIEG